MNLHRVTWTTGMGVPESTISAVYDFDRERVTVDEHNRRAMIVGLRRSGIFDDETVSETARGLMELPTVAGWADVTDYGGGWAQWTDSILDCGCGHRSHPGLPCGGSGADLDAEYGIDPTEPCACTIDNPS